MNNKDNPNVSDGIKPSVIIFWIVFFTFLLIWFVPNSNNGYFQTVVLTLTLFVLAWYTVETRRMQQAVVLQAWTAVRQTNLSIQPIFTVHIGEVQTELRDRRYLDRLELENIGNGVALNIQIDTLNLDLGFEAPSILPDPHIVFERVVSIEKGRRVAVEHTTWAGDHDKTGNDITRTLDLMRHLSPPRAERDYEMRVRFSDMMGNRYVQTIHVGKIGSWPDAVESDPNSIIERTPAYFFNPSPFTAGPLKYLKWKRRPPTPRV